MERDEDALQGLLGLSSMKRQSSVHKSPPPPDGQNQHQHQHRQVEMSLPTSDPLDSAETSSVDLTPSVLSATPSNDDRYQRTISSSSPVIGQGQKGHMMISSCTRSLEESKSSGRNNSRNNSSKISSNNTQTTQHNQAKKRKLSIARVAVASLSTKDVAYPDCAHAPQRDIGTLLRQPPQKSRRTIADAQLSEEARQTVARVMVTGKNKPLNQEGSASSDDTKVAKEPSTTAGNVQHIASANLIQCCSASACSHDGDSLKGHATTKTAEKVVASSDATDDVTDEATKKKVEMSSFQKKEDSNTVQIQTDRTTLVGIKTPSANDVICGRGGSYYNHTGNLVWRNHIHKYRAQYFASSKNDKPIISKVIVRLVRETGGRFLKLDDATSLWFEIGDELARDKTSQQMREKLSLKMMRQKQEKQRLLKLQLHTTSTSTTTSTTTKKVAQQTTKNKKTKTPPTGVTVHKVENPTMTTSSADSQLRRLQQSLQQQSYASTSSMTCNHGQHNLPITASVLPPQRSFFGLAMGGNTTMTRGASSFAPLRSQEQLLLSSANSCLQPSAISSSAAMSRLMMMHGGVGQYHTQSPHTAMMMAALGLGLPQQYYDRQLHHHTSTSASTTRTHLPPPNRAAGFIHATSAFPAATMLAGSSTMVPPHNNNSSLGNGLLSPSSTTHYLGLNLVQGMLRGGSGATRPTASNFQPSVVASSAFNKLHSNF